MKTKIFIVNFHPISLLPILGKISVRLISNSLLNYFLKNKHFIPSQSGFLPVDSCIVQLLLTLHEIQTVFDENTTGDVTGVSLDIPNRFDKVWHESLIFKLKAYGIEGELLSLLENDLQNLEQRVALNGQTSE